MLRRAWNTVGIIVLLEFFRTALPGFIEWLIFKDPECIEYVYTLFCVDILQFAMMSMLVIALFKKLNLKPAVMLIIAVVCSIAGQLLQMVSTGSRIGDIAVGFLWHSHEQAYFPLLNWLILLVCGYIFGDAWLRLKDKKSFFRFVTPVSWVISIAYFFSMAFAAEEYYLSGGYYYGIGILGVVFALIICFAMIGLGYYLNQWGGIGYFVRNLYEIQKKKTLIFCSAPFLFGKNDDVDHVFVSA